MSKLVAYVNNMCNDSIDWKVDPIDLEEGTPLYTTPQKYCPSENNAAYEKGFIDGMAKQRDSKVQQFVEAYVNKEDGLVCAKCYKPFTEMLTDEEIMECFKEVNLFTANMVDVARAILRKAQEK